MGYNMKRVVAGGQRSTIFSPLFIPRNMSITIGLLITMLTMGNPLPSPTYSSSSSSSASQGQGVASASTFYYSANPNRLSVVTGTNNPPSSVNSSKTPPFEQQPVIPNPSELTFKLNPYCQADVSLERVVCSNLRKAADLPRKEKYFESIQQAVFVNISVEGDLRLEDFRLLFPNLVVLSITQSPLSAASLINLKSSGASGRQGQMRASLPPKSLLADPVFAKRLNSRNFLNSKPTLTSSSSSPSSNSGGGGSGALGIGSRSGRALAEESEDDKIANKSASAVTSASLIGNVQHEEEDEAEQQKDEPEIETNEIPSADTPEQNGGDDGLPEAPQRLRRLVWPTIKHLNLSWNELNSNDLPEFLGNVFPNMEQIDLSNNFLDNLDKIKDADWNRLQSIDISGNPLDCTNLDWIESPKIKLLHPNQTLCDQPPHQNKAKPIFKVLRLLKKVREECRVNCSCDIAYIWEQNHVVHSKTVVNCSGRGFLDFPNPDHLPHPTDSLDLRRNKISSMSTFVDDHRYIDLNLMNLYLDDNKISSIDILERSEWFYHFQVFSIRRNDLSEVPVYVLENVFRQNKRLLQIDLSSNKFKCDCYTVSSFKVWLLKYTSYIANIEQVRCDSTKEQVRYMRMEEWCKVDNGTELLNVLDMVSIVLAILIIVVISKVYYDYWNFKTKGKLPWIVSKM